MRFAAGNAPETEDYQGLGQGSSAPGEDTGRAPPENGVGTETGGPVIDGQVGVEGPNSGARLPIGVQNIAPGNRLAGISPARERLRQGVVRAGGFRNRMYYVAEDPKTGMKRVLGYEVDRGVSSPTRRTSPGGSGIGGQNVGRVSPGKTVRMSPVSLSNPGGAISDGVVHSRRVEQVMLNDEAEEYEEPDSVLEEEIAVSPVAKETRVRGLSKWPAAAAKILMKPGHTGITGETVQDCLRLLEYMMKQAMTSALLTAGNDLKLMMSGIDVEKAKPLAGMASKEKLEQDAKDLVSEMKGSHLFSSLAKQSSSDDVEMPALLMWEVHKYFVDVAGFSCSFSPDAVRAWKANAVDLESEKFELKKMVNHRLGHLSVGKATCILEDLTDSLQERVKEALETTHLRQESALLIMRATEGRKVPKFLNTEDPYAARNKFMKIGNQHQESADMGEKKRSLLDSLSELAGDVHSEARKSLMARRMCKWHFVGNCTRGNACRFTHLSTEELASVQVTPEEARAAIPAPRRG